MRTLVAVLGLLVLAGGARAQEKVPREEAQKYAKLFGETAKTADDAPIKTEVDADKPDAVRHDKFGVMVIPDKKLTAEAIDKADKDVVPVGQFWLRNLSPCVDGAPVSADRLRVATVKIEDEEHQLPVCILGIQKKSDGERELLVYAKDKEPVLRVPLKKAEAASQDLPIEIEGRRGDEKGEVVFKLLGKYEAVVTVVGLEL